MPAYRDSDVDRFVEQVVPRVLAGQRQVAGQMAAYVAASTRRPSSGVAADLVTGAAARGGVDPYEVYRRPAVTVYTHLAKGTPVDVAVKRGSTRLMAIVATDLQLAKRGQAQLSMTDADVTRFRRVLTGAEDCALCAIASENLYRTSDLMPIHPLCDCDVEPDSDGSIAEGLNVDRTDAGSIAAQLAARAAVDVVVQEHGEYGPTLAWAGEKFTGPEDI